MSDSLPQKEVYVIQDKRGFPHHVERGVTYPLYRDTVLGALCATPHADPSLLRRSEVYYGVRQVDPQMKGGDVPSVLLCYEHRYFGLGMKYKAGFRQAGCRVRSAGPRMPHVGSAVWLADYDEPDYELPSGPVAVERVLAVVAADNFFPDMLIMVDELDDFYLCGESQCKFVWIAVENWNWEQHRRASDRHADAEFYQVRHWQRTDVSGETVNVLPAEGEPPPLLPNAQYMLFAVEPCLRPYLNLPRDKFILQLATPYAPRPRIWNALRKALDNADGLSDNEWLRLPNTWMETPRTCFGYARRPREWANWHNRTHCVLSSSNVDYVPDRVPDAFAMGAVLLSDDVPAMRAAYGTPWPENAEGIWVKHDRSSASILESLMAVRDHPEAEQAIRERALFRVYTQDTYAHRARTILNQLGIQWVGRLV